jgi:hypothetical protein
MQIEVTFDKVELENMLKDLLRRQGLKLSGDAEDAIIWKTRKGFRVVVKAEVDPAAATPAPQQRGIVVPVSGVIEEGNNDTNLDLGMFPDPKAAALLEDGLVSSIPVMPGETATRPRDTSKVVARKPTRKDRGAGR